MRATYLEAQLAMLGPNDFLSPEPVLVGFVLVW
jgi:hypothetical protein